MNLNDLKQLDDGLWVLQATDKNHIEIAIEGDAEAPFPRAKKLAKQVIEKRPHYVRMCLDYLEIFIDPRTFDSEGRWEVEAMVFEDSDESFEMHITLDDDPGLWTVMFFCAQTENDELETQPVKFARETSD